MLPATLNGSSLLFPTYASVIAEFTRPSNPLDSAALIASPAPIWRIVYAHTALAAQLNKNMPIAYK